MGRKQRKQLKSPEKASEPRHLPRRSPRFYSLAGSSQPQLQVSNRRRLRRSPRLKIFNRKLQRQLRINEQKKREGTIGKKKAKAKLITSLKDAGINIISLPPEILTKIFSYLTHNELGQIARVCRKFHKCTRCPTLWKKVAVKFSWFNGFQNDVASIFTKYLSSSVIHLKLDFAFLSWNQTRCLNFNKLCVNLKERCMNLHTLILHYIMVSEDLPSLIDLCSEFFPNLKALIFSKAIFGPCREQRSFGISKIKMLTVFQCEMSEELSYLFTKLPYLEKLNFTGTHESHYWFLNDDDLFSLHQLKVLHLGNTSLSFKIFPVLKCKALNLTELSLCYSKLVDRYFSVNESVFPLLKTVCLRCCPFITCEAVVSLVQSCKSLQNIYVDRNTCIAETYANHPFVISNVLKLEIVKAVDYCDHFEEPDCFFSQ